MPYPNLLAGGITNEGSLVPFELYGGESDIVTSQGTAHEAIPQFRVLMRHTDGTLKAWDGTAGAAFAIAAQPIAINTPGPIFIGGSFNYAALDWNGHAATAVLGKMAFDGTNIQIGTLLGGTNMPMTFPP